MVTVNSMVDCVNSCPSISFKFGTSKKWPNPVVGVV